MVKVILKHHKCAPLQTSLPPRKSISTLNLHEYFIKRYSVDILWWTMTDVSLSLALYFDLHHQQSHIYVFVFNIHWCQMYWNPIHRIHRTLHGLSKTMQSTFHVRCHSYSLFSWCYIRVVCLLHVCAMFASAPLSAIHSSHSTSLRLRRGNSIAIIYMYSICASTFMYILTIFVYGRVHIVHACNMHFSRFAKW